MHICAIYRNGDLDNECNVYGLFTPNGNNPGKHCHILRLYTIHMHMYVHISYTVLHIRASIARKA